MLALVELLREQWHEVGSKTALTKHELDAAEALADKLMMGIEARKRPGPQRTAAIEQRRRAFTLLANAYDEARRAISFLRWKHGDADSIAPSLFGDRTGRRGRRGQRETHVAG